MENRIRVETSDDLVEVHVTGKLTKEMYAEFVPRLEREIEKRGKLNVMFVMRDFHGWTAGALWEDIKYDLKHFTDIRRLALVGEKRWQQGMTLFCRPFTTAKLKYFDLSEEDAAREWARAAAPAPTPQA